jgi:hypothetical protein
VAVTNARQSSGGSASPSAKPVPKTWFNSFPARAALRAVAATLSSYCQALMFCIDHDGHDQYVTVYPGKVRVVCGCGQEKRL